MKALLVITAFMAIFCLATSMPAGEKNADVKPSDIKPLPVQRPSGPTIEEQPNSKPEEEKPEGEEPEEEEEQPEEEEQEEEEEPSKEEKDGPKTEQEEEEEEEAELNPDLFEGDLKLSKSEIEKLKGNTVSKKDAVASAARRWPNARVPFVIDRSFNQERKDVLKKAIEEFNKKTCVRFVPKTRNDKNYIRFFVRDGCFSTEVGKKRSRGQQYISIGNRCNYLGTVVHEMMHAIGFFHEHTRLDRDQYVTINWQNIEKGRESQFQKYAHDEADYLKEPYDYDSVMHYPRTGFGIKINGKRLPTLVPKDKPWRRIGQRNGFSDIDVRQINKLYKCTKFTSKY